MLLGVTTKQGRLIPEKTSRKHRTLFLCVSPSAHPPGPRLAGHFIAGYRPGPSLSHDPPREGKGNPTSTGKPDGGTVLPPYAAPTDIDTQATNIATEHKLGRGHELGAADPLSRSSAPTSKVRGLGFRTRLGEHGLASLTHAPQQG